ncbi:MAG: hypothetical protein IT383_28810 [Deltaproteobacteria bacterium]|nr:hypothetical protein [Deltaproteobacteria bacterium]
MADEWFISEMVVKSRATIKPGMTEVSLLEEGPASDKLPITKRDEASMMRAITGEPAFAQLLMRKLLMPDEGVRYALEVARPIIYKPDMVPGDVDLVCAHEQNPAQAVGVEAKQVRAITSNGEEDELKRTGKILGGIRQANGLRELGFHRSYYLVLVATDGRMKTENNVFARGVRGRTVTAIQEVIFSESGKRALHPDVGVVVVELVQPAPRAFDELSNVIATVVRMARPVEQPTQLTNRVADALGIKR